MAEWKQTLEPYIKVQERVMTAALNPTVGEELIVGVAFISDAGPSNPQLITSQKEFLDMYASEAISKNYLKSLDNFYQGDIPGLASTMWANAYRLAGSTNLLCVRASKSENLYYAKPLDIDGSEHKYVLKDGNLLKLVPSFKFVIDEPGDDADHNTDGWSISVRGVGTFGNRVTNEGAQYDYYVSNVEDLVEKLNETSMFFSPKFRLYTDAYMTTEATGADAKCVVFDEVYLGPQFLETNDLYRHEEGQNKDGDPCIYIIPCQPSWTADNPEQGLIDLNDDNSWSGSQESEYFALNIYNSKSPLKVRIRRFNHDAVVSTELSSTERASLTEDGKSPYKVLPSVLDFITKYGTEDPDANSMEKDFFEIAVYDPSLGDEVNFFNVGNISGRGDIEISELNEMLNMISLELPEDLHDLGLNYYNYQPDDNIWRLVSEYDVTQAQPDIKATLEDLLATQNPPLGGFAQVTDSGKYYQYVKNGRHGIYADLSINTRECHILEVTDADLMKAIDKIQENEVYIVEGLSDLGNTNLAYQNYLANISNSEDGNYFYPISSVNSTNYMTIGNSATKLSAANSYKQYMSAPWDIDTGTLGIKFDASPSVIYWEGVAANYRNGRPYASLFGQTYGKVNYQRPACEFNKKQRQLLLSRKVNTPLWNTNMQIWQMNDNYTMQSENTIMNDEGNVRMGIHIAKVQPQLLAQFIGKKITEKLCADIRSVEEYWINNNIMNLDGNKPEAFQVFCDYDANLARQNKVRVVINVRFSRSLKFVNVVDRYFDTGMDISSAE